MVKCDYCKKELKRKFYKSGLKKKTNFCNKKCLSNYRKKGNEKSCLNCGKLKYYKKYKLEKQKHFFCGLKCRKEYYKRNGHKFSKLGKEHQNWKGNKVGYLGVHNWIKNNYSKPDICEICGRKRKLDLANISGKYKRNINDFKWLCRSCHFRYDKTKFRVISEEIKSINIKKCDEKFYDIETETENFIAEDIITHNSKPNKKSISVGEYLPDILKEKIDIAVCIDVSGSIGKKELNDFLSEIIGMARAFQERINMRLLTHETEINNDWVISNGNIDKIKRLEIKGGGGTAHTQPFNFIRDNVRDCKAVIFLTDGYSDLDSINFNEYPFEKIFVINKGGIDTQLKDKECRIIHLKD